MKYFIYFTMSDSQPGAMPSPEGMAKMGQLMQESFDRGIIVATGQLPGEVTKVELQDGQFSITDGPFIEGKEFIPGFTIIEATSREDALQWAKDIRSCMGDGTIRVALLSASDQSDLNA